MSDGEGQKERGFGASVRRFFWLPRGTPRGAASVQPLARVWIAVAVVGAGGAALGWGDFVSAAMLVGTVCALLDDVIEGVRHRWLAFVAGLLGGWSADKLVRAVTDEPADPDWADYPALAAGTLTAVVLFVVITRLPVRRRVQP